MMPSPTSALLYALLPLLLPLLTTATPFSARSPLAPPLLHPIEARYLPLVTALPTTLTPCSIYGNAIVQCYEGAGTSFTAAATVHGGHFYQCACSAVGEAVDGNPNWDFIPDTNLPGGGCYVPAYYTTRPCGNSTLPAC